MLKLWPLLKGVKPKNYQFSAAVTADHTDLCQINRLGAVV